MNATGARGFLQRFGLMLVLGAALALPTACSLDPERKPIPVMEIHLLEADDGYTLNGQQMTMAQIKRELLETAQQNRREKSGDSRAVVRLYLPPGVASPRKNGHEITLEQLATHTSGLPRLPPNWNATVTNELNPYLSYTAADLYQSLAQVQLSTVPGQTSDYSNYGFGLLGQLLSLKTGLPYETLVRQTVCEPLGLTNTVIHLNAEQRDRLAPGHNPQGNIVPNWDMDALAGCGALRSNAHDLLTLLSANLETNNTPIYQALAEARKYHFKEFSGGVGLGWQIAEPVDGRVVWWHNGGTGGYYSFIAFDRQNHVGVVILSNYGDAFAGDSTIDHMGMDLLKLAGKVSWQ